MEELTRRIVEHKIEVVFIDPLYLCLLSGMEGGRRFEAANLFDMGPLLMEVGQTCLTNGATPILLHHFKQSAPEPYAVPDIGDFAFAGFQEYIRQWILMRRRERYVPGTGEHKLWLAVGGSAGHSGEWCLDIREGTASDDFGGRFWDVSVKLPSEVHLAAAEQRQAETERKEAEKRQKADERSARQTGEDAEKIRQAMLKIGKPETLNKIRAHTRLSGGRAQNAMAMLVDTGQAAEANVKVSAGGGSREVQGYVLTGKMPNPD
jgi:hypothetical protein